jgi:hypothetical protein
MKHILPYNNFTPILEKLTAVDDDVNLIYDLYFKKDIEEIEKTGIVKSSMFQIAETDTSILQSEESLKGNELAPCKILINRNQNGYDPINKIILISVNFGALNFALGEGGNIEKTSQILPVNQRTSFLKEFTKEKIKGSIHHELTHWLDDVFNNQHILKRVKKQISAGTRNIGGKPVNAEKFEIQGQIHNIKQLHNSFSDKWNEMTFREMISLSPALNTVYNQLNSEQLKQWKRDLKTRMSREGLLGNKMRD